MLRRHFLQQAAALPLAVQTRTSWNAGSVAHLLPAVSHERFLIKASFREPLAQAPRLRFDKRTVAGTRTDTRGRFWWFDADRLEPSRPYTLVIEDSRGKPLCDPWTLKTFPSPSDNPAKLRVLIYTCAGGHEVHDYFLPVSVRRRLLDRALSFEPDALIAIGDHVYWDLRTRGARTQGASPAAIEYAGVFTRNIPVLGTSNEAVLLKAVGPQIADLYQTRCRSTPVFFVQDDHDYFENDEAGDDFVSLPPDDFMLRLGRATRRLYYPEYLPDVARPSGLPGASYPDSPPGTAECYGTLRYGQLAEMLLYDCRRYLSLAGPTGVFVAPEAEQWLQARMAAPGVAHVVNIPSTPPGWSAGKWGEWYPDILETQGRLTVAKQKPFWQSGWAAQHDRLLAASSGMHGRVPLFVSGDLHSIGETRIQKTGGESLQTNPVCSVLSGPLGTGKRGWPSDARGTRALPPSRLEVDERSPALEENGFLLAEFTPESITLRFFRWSRTQPPEAIDGLEPFRVTELKRG